MEDLFPLARLEPVFASGALAQARAAFDRGRYPTVLELLSDRTLGPLSPQARYLKGLALLRAGLPAEAARELLALTDLYPALRDRCRFSAAVALEEAGQALAAADAYGRVAPSSPLRREAMLGRARTLSVAGDLAAALAALAPLRTLAAPVSGSGRDFGAEALFTTAEWEEARGHASMAAARAYREVWLRHPLYRAAGEAEARVARIAARLSKPVAQSLEATPAELLARAELLLAAHRLAPALAALAPLAAKLPLGPTAKGTYAGRRTEGSAPGHAVASKGPTALACRAHLAVGRALRQLRRHAEAIAELRPVVDLCRAADLGDLRARALYVLGSSASIVQPALGERIYEALATDYPGHSFADDALYYEADLYARAGDVATARRILERLVETYPEGDFALEALFHLFWLDRAAGQPEAGLPSLERLGALGRAAGKGELDEPLLRADYWRARTLADAPAPQGAEGVRALDLLARRAPFSYYGALALGRLPAGAVPAPVGALDEATPKDLSLHAGTLVSDPEFQAGVELLRMGFLSAATEELGSVDRRLLSGPTGRAEPLLLLALCLDRAGDHRSAHAIAKGAIAGRRPAGQSPTTAEGALATVAGRLLWRVAFPLAYRSEIVRWTSAVKVPPDLMQALVREESALDPKVISGAGAIGLSQLMLPTANRMAQQLGLGRVTASQLEDPSLNLRLGSLYVSKLLRRYSGNPALTLGAYNAGEGAVDRWLAARGGEPLDAFVEEIPIGETRGYVKRVLGTYATYRFLYGSGPERLSPLAEPLASRR